MDFLETQADGDGRKNLPQGLKSVCENPELWGPSGAHCRSLGFLRISCQGLVASVNLVRLSLKKAAYVAVDWCSVVGNPEFARDDKGWGGSSMGNWLVDEKAVRQARSERVIPSTSQL
jgi:hypothetical protein